MVPEIGHFALILALAVAIIQGGLPVIGAARGDVAPMEVARPGGLAPARRHSVLRTYTPAAPRIDNLADPACHLM
jgi:cytochrome c biogenesis factor